VDATTQALLGALSEARMHVTGILDGLDADALRTPVLPTGWSCLGLVQHLALDVERFWFGGVMAGGLDDPQWPDDASAWDVDPSTPPDVVLDGYRAEIAAADAVITTTPLEQPPAAWPARFGSFRLPDLRAVMLHVIVETTCHAGHLDAARELLDGRTWMVLT
jgi:uncharacterized damage-inducible protein DinB